MGVVVLDLFDTWGVGAGWDGGVDTAESRGGGAAGGVTTFWMLGVGLGSLINCGCG